MKPSGDSACELCNGTGFVKVPPNERYPEGAMTVCQCRLRALRRRSLERMMPLTGLSEEIMHQWRFGNFVPSAALADDAGRAELARIKHRCIEYAQSPRGWLVLCGAYGCGKSHLAYAAAAASYRQGHAVYAATVPDLLESLRQTFSSDQAEDTFDRRFNLVREAGLLLLDDLGAENHTAWGAEKLYQIIDYRHRMRLPLIITTNVNLYDPKGRIEPRILSRILDGANLPDGLSTVFLMQGRDYRQRLPAKAQPTPQR